MTKILYYKSNKNKSGERLEDMLKEQPQWLENDFNFEMSANRKKKNETEKLKKRLRKLILENKNACDQTRWRMVSMILMSHEVNLTYLFNRDITKSIENSVHTFAFTNIFLVFAMKVAYRT